jgi:hypothetical protein
MSRLISEMDSKLKAPSRLRAPQQHIEINSEKLTADSFKVHKVASASAATAAPRGALTSTGVKRKAETASTTTTATRVTRARIDTGRSSTATAQPPVKAVKKPGVTAVKQPLRSVTTNARPSTTSKGVKSSSTGAPQRKAWDLKVNP